LACMHALKKVCSFDIEAIPPYSFELTVHRPAGWWWSTPKEIFGDNTLWTAIRFRGGLVGLKLWSSGTLMEPRIRCAAFRDEENSDAERSDIASMIKRALRTEEDLNDFYAMARKDDILKDVVRDLLGMRTLGWPDLFPALILAVTLQMAPMKRSRQMMELLIENFGDEVSFDGKTVFYWPSEERIANTPVEELKAKAKLGYRAGNLLSIARTLTEGFPTMEELWEMPHKEVKKRLLSLRGIGEYSAELVVPETGFPLDIWSAKIFHVLFFGREPESPREAIQELKKTAQERWGKWRGHAFVYVLNDLPEISKRIGVDLTRF
jgi:3-methyladenine DNA glycosylase/8-oxoguanine DNA glycosylase